MLLMNDINTLLLLFNLFSLVLSWTVETRRSTLFPWKHPSTSTDDAIGWVVEERSSQQQTLQVTVGWNDADETDTTTISLAYIQNVESLASSLWPPALAGAILCQSPSLLKSSTNNNNLPNILEVGTGLGLTGQVLAQTTRASTCLLTDKDGEIIQLVQDSIAAASNDTDSTFIQAACLEWRDDHDENDRNSMDIVMGTAVAYYHHLLRPLLNTILHYLKVENSLLLVIGQANRDTQWDLYDSIQKGCYNPDSDVHEQAWNGTTRMLLYQLEMQEWQQRDDNESSNSTEKKVDGVVGIAVLVHTTPGLEMQPLTKSDYVAQEHDREQLSMSF